MRLHKFAIFQGQRKVITSSSAKIEKYFWIKKRKVGFFGKEKYVDFKIKQCNQGGCWTEVPTFRSIGFAEKYMKQLEEVFK